MELLEYHHLSQILRWSKYHFLSLMQERKSQKCDYVYSFNLQNYHRPPFSIFLCHKDVEDVKQDLWILRPNI